MKAIQDLPVDYKKNYSVNFQKDKKTMMIVNGLAILIVILMIVPANLYIPISSFFSMEFGFIVYITKIIVLLTGSIIYMVLHELIHGITMKYFGTKKVKYGFTGLYAFAASDDYYDKKSYIVIALAPVVVFLFVFLIITIIVNRNWFWVAYMLQVINISGAAGDFFVTYKFYKMPKDLLVKDNGISMDIYSK